MTFFGTFLTSYEIIFCASLFLSVVSIWAFSQTISAIFIYVSCLLGFLFHFIDWLGLSSLIFISFIIWQYYYKDDNLLKKILLAGIITIGIGGPVYYFRFMPGFIDFPLIENVHFSSDSLSYSFYVGSYKILTGLILLLYGKHALSHTAQEWSQAIRVIPIPLCLLAILLIGSAFAFHYVRFDPKMPPILLLWAAINLLFVCVAEEVFFRGFLQKELMLAFGSIKGRGVLALGITAFLFGLAHYPGGLSYIILSFFAGLGYGYVYLQSKNIESCILLHFLVNLIHFIGFSYPALNQSIAY